jgi:hypothetical protein
MAYNKAKIYKSALEVIKENELVFIEGEATILLPKAKNE